MPSTPHLVSGTVYTSRGTVPSSIVIIKTGTDSTQTTTDSEGKYTLDLANLDEGYSDGDIDTIQSWDEFNKEYISQTFTVAGENQTQDLYLLSRTENTDLTKNSDTRRSELRTVGNTPVTEDNPLPVATLERQYTQNLAYVSGTSRVEFVGKSPAGSPVSQAKWRIEKWVYSGTDLVKILWASGNTEFDKVWDDRASYTYA